ncbi:MAG TPA: DNA polymerase ligase N-terminal domain-containing protein [Patescibacteria group bacterium]|nr:DNA polymerase ligase N-terminal domain-containing protein [Patescibacteria group bacterium]
MLEEYQAKRKFEITPEPKPSKAKKTKKGLIYVVQKHQAQNLHYDLRLEENGVLKSWAVPKGIPKKFGEKHLAIQTEDHPLEYAEFSGKIPEGEYGAGLVEIWDKGEYRVIKDSVEKGHLQFEIRGDKFKGKYNLIRFKRDDHKLLWLLFKINK